MGDEALLHYRILEKIGEGGMGVVYKALDTRLDRPVAIKTFPAIQDARRRRQFIWEARAAAAMRHPNIVVVHDFASDQGTDFIVMEYIPGSPLSELMTGGPLSLRDALRYAREIASALEAAHTAGIVHRDLKPSNILVTPEGTTKLVDFGLARLQQQDPVGPSGAIYAVAGTVGYMSPEQAQGEATSAQSDIFSFGVVLYEMVTGRRAFTGTSAASLLAALLRDDPPSPSSLNPEVPPALERIIEQCLRKNPQRRLRHMGDVRLALEDVSLTPGKAQRWISASWRGVLIYAGLAIMPMLAAGLLISRHSDPGPATMPIPLTSFPGHETSPAWSPDGRQLAFDWDGEKEDNNDLYIVQPGSSQTSRLTTEAGVDTGPAWSPDGRWIAYTHHTDDDSKFELDLVSPMGGPKRTVLSNAGPLSVSHWTADSKAVLINIAPERNRPSVLWALFLDTGEHRQLTWPPAGIPGDLHPVLSPDGKTLAFTRKTAWRTAELYLLDLKPNLTPTGPPRQMTNLGYVADPVWTPDGDRIVFEAHRQGSGIWQIDRTGKHLSPVFGVANNVSTPALARRPDGKTSLVYTTSEIRSMVYQYSTERGGGAPRVELAPSSRSQSYPQYSHDGKKLAFSSSRSGYFEIWVGDADGSHAVQITDLRHQLTEMGHWSPADDWITFVSQATGARQVYVVSTAGGAAIPITDAEGVNHTTGWSRDGAWVYYQSSQSGQLEVWKTARGGGRAEQMTSGGGMNGFESDRGTFYYWRQSGGPSFSLMRRTPNGDQEVPMSPLACACTTSLASEGFYYRATGSEDIYVFDEGTGRSSLVMKNPPRAFNHFTISPDRRRFAAGFVGPERVDLMIMENFR